MDSIPTELQGRYKGRQVQFYSCWGTTAAAVTSLRDLQVA